MLNKCTNFPGNQDVSLIFQCAVHIGIWALGFFAVVKILTAYIRPNVNNVYLGKGIGFFISLGFAKAYVHAYQGVYYCYNDFQLSMVLLAGILINFLIISKIYDKGNN